MIIETDLKEIFYICFAAAYIILKNNHLAVKV